MVKYMGEVQDRIVRLVHKDELDKANATIARLTAELAEAKRWSKIESDAKQECEQVIDRLTAERGRYEQREKHFAEVLRVADGGRYANDWDSAIRRVVAERDAAVRERDDAVAIVDKFIESHEKFSGDMVMYSLHMGKVYSNAKSARLSSEEGDG